MKKTIYINLYGAPGSGKSTGASWLFSKFKLHGIDCEYVQEFAKDMVWENNKFVFDDPDNQFYISAQQFYRLNRLNGKVDYVITDSPLLLSALYTKGSRLDNEAYYTVLKDLYDKFENKNYRIVRVKHYHSNGRNQSEEEANAIDSQIGSMLKKFDIDPMWVAGDEHGYGKIFNDVTGNEIY